MRFHKTLIIIVSLLSFCFHILGNRIIVADISDRYPVTGATAINRDGMIVGFSDANGAIAVSSTDFPVTLRSMGYESKEIYESMDTLFLTPATYPLSEVTVSAGERPISRVTAYAREYCSGITSTDTLQMYSEYMLEYFFADGKVKGFKKQHESPHVLAVKRYANISTSQCPDSIFQPKEDDEITFLSFMTNLASLPNSKIIAPAEFANGAKGIEVQGKYGVEKRLLYKPELFVINTDFLANYKDHSWSPWFFKMLGMTTDINEFDSSYIYRRNESHKYGINDLVSGRYNLKMLARGKGFKHILKVKEGIDINCLIEQYPVSVEHLTLEEYNECKKDFHKRKSEFVIPSSTEPLPAPIQNLVNRFN